MEDKGAHPGLDLFEDVSRRQIHSRQKESFWHKVLVDIRCPLVDAKLPWVPQLELPEALAPPELPIVPPDPGAQPEPEAQYTDVRLTLRNPPLAPPSTSVPLESESLEERAMPSGNATPTQCLCRSKRDITPPDKYSPSIYCLTQSEPLSYDDVTKLPKHEKQKWLDANKKELDSLRDLQVFRQVPVPVNQKILGCSWIFKREMDASGEVRYRDRLVAKGFLQTADDFDQTFSPVTKPETLRAALSYAAKNKCFLHQVDFETAFLNADLEQKIFLEIPRA